MLSCPTIRKETIRSHYNISTPFYRLLWGRHIHHGLWDAPGDTTAVPAADNPSADESSPKVAQERLTETLRCEAGLRGGERVLDVGCGMGGSSLYLAQRLGCDVTGITLSPFQRRWASLAARIAGLSSRARFRCADAETLSLPADSLDVVWSIECTEHLFDKPAFFRRAAQWLKPGGCVAICAWQAGEDPLTEAARQQVFDVCEGFFCPSLGSRADYAEWLQGAGLVVERYHDWTARVVRTWDICEQRVRRTGMHRLAHWLDPGQTIFLDRFRTIGDAYRSGAMSYGCWVARKSPAPAA